MIDPDFVGMAQRHAQLQELKKLNQGGKVKSNYCGGEIVDIEVSTAFDKKYKFKGKQGVVLECSFCGKSTLILNQKCHWCGESDSLYITKNKRELCCRRCEKVFAGATCRDCHKQSPAFRLKLLWSPDETKRKLEEKAIRRAEKVAAKEKADKDAAESGRALIVVGVLGAFYYFFGDAIKAYVFNLLNLN